MPLPIQCQSGEERKGERKLIYFTQSLILISLSILFAFCHGILHREISLIVSQRDNSVWKTDKYEDNDEVYDAF